MKSLELKLNKRLLIVESDEIEVKKEGIIYKDANSHLSDIIEGDFKLICKGPDLTEDVAKGFQHKNIRVAHNGEYLSATEEFKFHINNHGYHWGEHPLGKEPKLTDSKYNEELEFIENNPDELVIGDHYADWSMWQEAESRTFNPDKCLIFEIV